MGDTTYGTVLVFAQIAGQVVPLVTTTVQQLRALFRESEVDPALFDRIEAAYADRIAQAVREAEDHGQPANPAVAPGT